MIAIVTINTYSSLENTQENDLEYSIQIPLETGQVQCPICLNPIASNEQCTLVCKYTTDNNRHVFHLDCINDWWETNNLNCPACRSDNVSYLMPDGHIVKPSFIKKVVPWMKKINYSCILSSIAATSFLATCLYIYYTNEIFYNQEPYSVLERPIFCPSECLDLLFDTLQKNHST